MRWPWKRKPLPEGTAGKIETIVLAKHPALAGMEFEVFEAVYMLSKCLNCGEFRYAHVRQAKRHLVIRGGTG